MKLNVEFQFFIDTDYVEIAVFYKISNKLIEEIETLAVKCMDMDNLKQYQKRIKYFNILKNNPQDYSQVNDFLKLFYSNNLYKSAEFRQL